MKQKHTKEEILNSLKIRISTFDIKDILVLWNKFVKCNNKVAECDSEKESNIVSNNDCGIFDFSKDTRPTLHSYMVGLSNNMVRVDDKFLSYNKDNELISFNETTARGIIKFDKLTNWLYEIVAKRLRPDYDEISEIDEYYKEIIGKRAYTLINTTEYNDDGRYSVNTEEVDGIPLTDIEGWEWELLINQEVGEVINSEDFNGAMIIRVK